MFSYMELFINTVSTTIGVLLASFCTFLIGCVRTVFLRRRNRRNFIRYTIRGPVFILDNKTGQQKCFDFNEEGNFFHVENCKKWFICRRCGNILKDFFDCEMAHKMVFQEYKDHYKSVYKGISE